MNADDKCLNCHREFADHDYVKDSITRYKCPVPHVESGYGFFHGGDPRDFHPDGESCSSLEISNHRKACELWNEAEERGETPTPEACPSGWIYDDVGKAIAHVLRLPYGLGGYCRSYDQYFEPADLDTPDEDANG